MHEIVIDIHWIDINRAEVLELSAEIDVVIANWIARLRSFAIIFAALILCSPLVLKMSWVVNRFLCYSFKVEFLASCNSMFPLPSWRLISSFSFPGCFVYFTHLIVNTLDPDS